MDGDTVEAIQRDYLKGAEQSLNAFNRLVAFKTPVIPIAMQVRVERIEEPHGPAHPV